MSVTSDFAEENMLRFLLLGSRSARKSLLVAAVGALLLSGCGDDRIPKLNYPKWDELATMQSTELTMPIDTLYSQGDFAGFKKAIQSPQFAEALDRFDKSSIPGGFDNETRRRAKADAVANYRKCLELIKTNGSKAAISEAYDAAQASMRIVGAHE
jgi:hypothetical protein